MSLEKHAATLSFIALALWTSAVRAEASHPLDPLTAPEIVKTIAAIAASGKVDRTTRAAIVTLAEPAKTEVIAWRRGDPIPRRALAVVDQVARHAAHTVPALLRARAVGVEHPLGKVATVQRCRLDQHNLIATHTASTIGQPAQYALIEFDRFVERVNHDYIVA